MNPKVMMRREETMRRRAGINPKVMMNRETGMCLNTTLRRRAGMTSVIYEYIRFIEGGDGFELNLDGIYHIPGECNGIEIMEKGITAFF